MFKITILAENYAYKTAFSEWGFSALIETLNKKYLFDVGLSGHCVIENAKKLKVNLKNIDGIILSHGHYDHTDGLEKILNETGPSELYAHPNVFVNRFSQRVSGLEFSGMKLTQSQIENSFSTKCHLHKSITQISENIYMTGEVPFTNKHEKVTSHMKIKETTGELTQDFFPDDNSLILDTPKGLVIIFGCAHRGIVNIMSYVKKHFNKNIYGIIGGTHLYNAGEEHFNFVLNYLKTEKIELIAPGHCTGMDRIFDLKNVFKKRVTPAFCGETFIIK